MQNETTATPTRRRFITLGTTAVAALATIKMAFFSPAKKKVKTVKMLTEDGKLVEIDQALIPTQKKKVSNNDIHNWISKR